MTQYDLEFLRELLDGKMVKMPNEEENYDCMIYFYSEHFEHEEEILIFTFVGPNSDTLRIDIVECDDSDPDGWISSTEFIDPDDIYKIYFDPTPELVLKTYDSQCPIPTEFPMDDSQEEDSENES